MRDADDRGRVLDEQALVGQHAIRQQRGERGRERLGSFPTFDDRDEAFVKRRLLLVVETDVVLDRIGESTQEIGVRHHRREAVGRTGIVSAKVLETPGRMLF